LHEIVFERLADGVKDTITLGLACVKPERMSSIIEIGQLDTVCLSANELLGTEIRVFNASASAEAAAEFERIPGTNCFTCLGKSAGATLATLVICDEYGVCDTTFIDVTVRSKGRSVAFADTIRTHQEVEVNFNPLRNDLLNGTPKILRIIVPPAHGSVEVNDDFTFTYIPDEEYCNEDLPDSFVYEVCSTGSDCASERVLVFVECDDLKIYTGFSPNGDQINDFLRIDGLQNYPDHTLKVFNRWGAEVFSTRQYRNDWDGVWNGEPLPAGTYFFIFDNGEGEVKTGYVQIWR
jgi:gliding motility-associated-like protein